MFSLNRVRTTETVFLWGRKQSSWGHKTHQGGGENLLSVLRGVLLLLLGKLHMYHLYG